MSPRTRLWLQRGLVVAIWIGAFVAWRAYQSANDLSSVEVGQRFIDTVDTAWWGVFAFVGVYLLRPIVLFPASVITIMGGVLFGPVAGTLIVIVAANTSAMIAFGIGYFVGQDPDDASLVGKWSGKLRDKSFETVFIMRLIFLPYDLVNYLCGALRIRWTSFLLATALGSLPGTISFVVLGSSLERIDMGLDGLNPWAIVAGLAIFAASLVIARITRNRYPTDSELA